LGWPNRITITRLLLVWPFALCLLYMNAAGSGWLRWLAVAIFGAMAASDVLDGYLARRLGDESPLGRFLDPLADKLLITVAVLILCVVGIRDLSDPTAPPAMRLPTWVAVVAVGKDLVVSLGFAAVYFTTGRVLIRPRLFGKCCTVVQLLMVLSVLLWIDAPIWLSGLPEVLWYLATALAVAAALDYVRLGSQFVAGVAAENSPGSKGDQVDVGQGR
jgi:CDP-diacylglycerol--glycerol-3-phosphate 3-phosphatidyltransferase